MIVSWFVRALIKDANCDSSRSIELDARLPFVEKLEASLTSPSEVLGAAFRFSTRFARPLSSSGFVLAWEVGLMSISWRGSSEICCKTFKTGSYAKVDASTIVKQTFCRLFRADNDLRSALSSVN